MDASNPTEQLARRDADAASDSPRHGETALMADSGRPSADESLAALPPLEPVGSPHPSRFISFKWKALILFGLVPVLTSVLFTVVTYRDQIGRFEASRELAQSHYREAFAGLVQQGATDLIQLGNLIPSLENVGAALLKAEAGGLKQAFDPHWPLMQLELELDVVRIYDKNSRFLGGWSIPGTEGGLMVASEERWVRQVIETEDAVTLLDCVLGCLRYAMVPLLAEGQAVGVVVLATSLADSILAFREITGADVGVLVPESGIGDNAGARSLAGWNFKWVALTDPGTNGPVLHDVAARFPPPGAEKRVVQLRVGERDFEVALSPLAEFSGDSAGFLVVVDNITDEVGAIEQARWSSLMVGGLGLLASELLLLALLWGPMKRLRRTARMIPMLGEGRFPEVREGLPVRRSGMVDEIDLLDQTAVALAIRLEALETEVRDREQALSRSVSELGREKDFVQGLLETAQVIIITQDYRGHITMINRYGEQVTGYSRAELVGESMAGRLFPPDIGDELRQAFADLVQGRREHIKQESLLVCRDAAARTIAWLHSRVAGSLGGKGRVLSVGLDVTEARRQEKHIKYQADHDTLTGLFNRRRFQEELDRIFVSPSRQKHGGALMCLDVDEFKSINDTRGHQAGDTLLRTLAEELHVAAGDEAILSRLGGDEFAVLLPGANAETAEKFARETSRRMAGLLLPGESHGESMSASIGIALFPTHGTSTYDLLVNAGVAVDQAKKLGRGHYHVFSPDEQARERLRQRAQWVARIERALATDNLVLVFQPIMHILTGSISHYEVLVRMRLPDGKLHPPGAFIPLAEETGLIRPLDNLVVKKAIAKLAEVIKSGRDVRFAVNLSGRTMEDPDLVANLEQHLQRYQLDPQRLIFEVTETAAVADMRMARKLVDDVRSLGCSFALDDFGVGFSSFSYLKHLTADYVKIDGSFIQNLAHSPDDQVITQALAQVVSGFGKRTIAEFVQDQVTIDLLREYGVDYAQGYYIGKPSQQLLDE